MSEQYFKNKLIDVAATAIIAVTNTKVMHDIE
jgi:hypothetical protein